MTNPKDARHQEKREIEWISTREREQIFENRENARSFYLYSSLFLFSLFSFLAASEMLFSYHRRRRRCHRRHQRRQRRRLGPKRQGKTEFRLSTTRPDISPHHEKKERRE